MGLVAPCLLEELEGAGWSVLYGVFMAFLINRFPE